MGIVDRVERGLERAIKAPFAKVFKAEVQPVEIAAAMRGAMDERAAVLGPGRTMVPNVFTIELATSDFERLSSYDTALTDELVAAAEDHADAQRYTPAGTVEVRLTSEDDLETGIFRVRPASKSARRQRPPRRASGPPAGMPSDQSRPPARQGGAPAGTAARPPAQQPPAAARQAPPGVGAAAVAARSGGQGPTGPGYGPGAPAYPPSGGHSQTREFPTTGARPQRPVSGRGPRPWLDLNGRAHSLSAAVTVLGRDASADLVIDDPGVSRRHAEVRITHDGPHQQVIVRDLGSTNGSYVNGDQVGTEQLGEGDRLTIGSTTLIFHTEGGR